MRRTHAQVIGKQNGLRIPRMRLFDDVVDTPDGAIPLGPDLEVTIEGAETIEKRITATRILAFGVFALAARKTTSSGSVFVVVTGREGGSVMEIDPKQRPAAMTFAAKANAAAKVAS